MKFIIIFLTSFLISCSNISSHYNWKESKNSIFYIDKLKQGDIIIKNKVLNSPLSWFGHSAIVLENGVIGEYPKLFSGYSETRVDQWLFDERKIIVLRYKKFDKIFKEAFFKNLNLYKDKKYKLFTSKNNANSFYCSKFIWFLFYKTAQDLNYELDIGSGFFFTSPYDFLKSEEFEQIILE